MSKLAAVIRHEYLTIVRQPTFWLIMLAIPALIAAILAISYFSAQASERQIEKAAEQVKDLVVVDASGLISQEIVAAAQLELRPTEARDQVIDQVKTGQLPAALVYPDDLLTSRQYQVYLSSNDFTQASTVSAVGDNLLRASLYAPLGSPEVIALAQQGAAAQTIAFEDGRQTAGLAEYIVPGIFVGLFYLVLVFSVNYMLTSVAEEKENRSMEMVLSYVRPRVLILGKLLGIALVTLTQLLFLGLVMLIAYLVARNYQSALNLPLDIDLSGLVFDPATIAVGLTGLILGFLLFAALMAGVGSMVPSAKDAGGLSFIFIIGAILPFYTLGIITTDPTSPITRFMTYFPTTAPTTILVRNTVDNLSTLEAVLALTALAASTVLAVLLAGKLFRLGALEYANRLSLKQLLGR